MGRRGKTVAARRDQPHLIGPWQSTERKPDMQLQAPSRRTPRVVPVLWVTALLAIACGLATTSSAVGSSKLNLAGTWSGKYSGAFSGTFKLHWTQTGSRLKGTIVLSNPTGP